jgi:hypothetical protein
MDTCKIRFIAHAIVTLFFIGSSPCISAQQYDWLSTARIFLIDAYYPPFAPKLEFDAEKLAQTMQEMHVNVVRMSTMGKYATIQGIRYSTHPDQGNRDLLAEMIAACKPRGIRVIPYISTGHKLAWSTVTVHYPDYAQRSKPGGGPARDHMYAGEDMGTICWNTSYRQAYLDYVTHVVKDYDVSGMYFDTWRPFYFWPGKKLCYCDGCVKGFRKATGLEIPWHEAETDYTKDELAAIDKYHSWYHEQLMGVLAQVRSIVKSIKDVPMIYNIENPNKIAREDPRIIASMDAFLYERSESMLERAEGVSLARTLGIRVIPYVGGYDNWPRIVNNQFDIQQQIFATMMFGGTPIISQPYGYINEKKKRKYVDYPFSLIEANESLLRSQISEPYVAVIYSSYNPEGHAKTAWWWKADARTATLGAFEACLYGHVQVTSAMGSLLDSLELLSRYKVLYLPDNVYLTEKQIKNIRQFVYDGGGLIASYASSLYDNNGKRNKSFALEELLRVRSIDLPEELNNYQAMIGGPSDLYLSANKDSAILNPQWKEVLAPTWYFEPVEVMNGGKIVMDIVTGDDNRPVLPGVVMSRFGKGKVLYSACSLESLYQGNGNPVLKELIGEFISLVAAEPASFTLKAPATVMANMTHSSDKYVLHLTNWTGNKFEKNHLMEDYIAPVEQVRILLNIPGNRSVASVKTITGSPFTMKKKGSATELVLPRLEAYEGIVIQVTEKKK